MMNSVREFAKSSDGTLENIEFVVYQDQMFEDFKTVVKSYKSVKPKSTSVMGAFWKTIKGTFTNDNLY